MFTFIGDPKSQLILRPFNILIDLKKWQRRKVKLVIISPFYCCFGDVICGFSFQWVCMSWCWTWCFALWCRCHICTFVVNAALM